MAERDVTDTLLNSSQTNATATKRGVTLKRFNTKAGVPPFEEIEWELRTAAIQNEKGRTIFEQRNVEVPKEWSMTATNIVASKYFHGKLDSPDRESSVRQLVSRV
ncbi:MAG: vitamin B12-dependent ribonucleotide reductase, partial [Terriglobia bacterium]